MYIFLCGVLFLILGLVKIRFLQNKQKFVGRLKSNSYMSKRHLI